MPDLITHVAGAYLVKKYFRIAAGASLFYLGAILPDVLSRPLHIIWSGLFPATQALHSPLGTFLACWLISLFFRIDQRRRVFALLLAGSVVHFILDMLQRHLVGGYAWLFPFSLKPYSFGFVGPEESLFYLPPTLGVVLLVYLVSRRRAIESGVAARTEKSPPGRRAQSSSGKRTRGGLRPQPNLTTENTENTEDTE